MGSFDTVFKGLPSKTDLTTHQTDVLVCPVFQVEKKASSKSKGKKSEGSTLQVDWSESLKLLDKALGGHIKATLKDEKFKADCGKKRIFKVRAEDSLKARWVVVLGLGKREKLVMRKAVSAFGASLKDTFGFEEVHHATVILPEAVTRVSKTQMLQSVVFGAIQSTYKTEEAGTAKIHTLKTVNLYPSAGTVSASDLQTAKLMALAESFTKDMANKPANLKTAEYLAESARSYASLPGVQVEVVSDLKKLQKEMPAFWAVAQGAAKVDPPRFIKVTYKPSGSPRPKKKIALVGKGVIFDTGGVQVKPGNFMNDMKFDMTGAATVLSVVRAAAEMKLKGIQVSAYVAATKNLTGEEAYLPDSIIHSASGKKIEIRHTDAEGRVTLADSVHKAVEDKPDEIITVATLTGAAGAAVGFSIALMGTNDKLVQRVEHAARTVGEMVQSFEMLDEDFESIKSDRDAADLSNTGKAKNRGHITAGAFVLTFAKDIPAAHLDIAGGDAKDGNATGIAVKGLIEYLRSQAS